VFCCRGLRGPPQASGKAKQLPEEVVPEVAMPDHESLQDHSTNSIQNNETMHSLNGRDIDQTTVSRTEVPRSSTLTTRSDNPEGSTVKPPFVVAQALASLTHQNAVEVADKIVSVGRLPDEELPGLAYMVSFCASYTSCTLPHNISHTWHVLQRTCCTVAWRVHVPPCLKLRHNLTSVLHTMVVHVAKHICDAAVGDEGSAQLRHH